MLKGQKEGLFTTDGGQNVLVIPLNLVAAALRNGCYRPIPMRGSASQHLQFLYQLFDVSRL